MLILRRVRAILSGGVTAAERAAGGTMSYEKSAQFYDSFAKSPLTDESKWIVVVAEHAHPRR